MASYENESKASVAGFNNEVANDAQIFNQIKPGKGSAYDSYLTYDEDPDPLSGNKRMYDTVGEEPTYTNEPKS